MKRLMVLGLLAGGLVLFGISQGSQAGVDRHWRSRSSRHSYGSYGHSYSPFRYYSPSSYGHSSYDYYPQHSGIAFGSSGFSFSLGSGHSPSYQRYGSSRYGRCR